METENLIVQINQFIWSFFPCFLDHVQDSRSIDFVKHIDYKWPTTLIFLGWEVSANIWHTHVTKHPNRFFHLVLVPSRVRVNLFKQW